MQLRSQPVQLRQVAQHASAHVAIQAAVQATAHATLRKCNYSKLVLVILVRCQQLDCQ